MFIKFIYSEKATKFCEISTVDLSYVVSVKYTVEISKNFVAFSEYMNFTNRCKSVVYIHGTSREVSRGATQQVVEECEVARK